MHDRTIILLADLQEFPTAQFYAECYSILFEDLGMMIQRKSYMPSRYDYTKVYVATSKPDYYSEIIKNFKNNFEVELHTAVPIIPKHTVRDGAGWLLQNSYIEPFEDMKDMLRKVQNASTVKMGVDPHIESAKRDYNVPDPKLELDKSIKLLRKQSRNDIDA